MENKNTSVWQDANKVKPEYYKEVLVLVEDKCFYLGYWSDNQNDIINKYLFYSHSYPKIY